MNKRVVTDIPEYQFKEFSEIAKSEGRTNSSLLRYLVFQYLKGKRDGIKN
jgi:hypothetical protein